MSDPGPIVVGLGLHRRMSQDELGELVRFRPHQHDPDDTVPTAVVDGINGSVSPWVAAAPFSIAVGVVELHQYAGVSGGHKAVAVGCGGRETIRALHARARVLDAGVRIGSVEGNPFRDAIDQLGRAARCRHALVWVPATGEWLFGSPEAVVREGLRRLNPWKWVDSCAPGVVLHIPNSKASSLYQASRAATYLSESPAPAVHQGGTIVIRASCPEGLGSELGFVRALHGAEWPWTGLLKGPEPTGAGAQRAVMMARLAQRYAFEIEGCVDPRPFHSIGIAASTSIKDRPAEWLCVRDPFQQLPQSASSRSSAR